MTRIEHPESTTTGYKVMRYGEIRWESFLRGRDNTAEFEEIRRLKEIGKRLALRLLKSEYYPEISDDVDYFLYGEGE